MVAGVAQQPFIAAAAPPTGTTTGMEADPVSGGLMGGGTAAAPAAATHGEQSFIAAAPPAVTTVGHQSFIAPDSAPSTGAVVGQQTFLAPPEFAATGPSAGLGHVSAANSTTDDGVLNDGSLSTKNIAARIHYDEAQAAGNPDYLHQKQRTLRLAINFETGILKEQEATVNQETGKLLEQEAIVNRETGILWMQEAKVGSMNAPDSGVVVASSTQQAIPSGGVQQPVIAAAAGATTGPELPAVVDASTMSVTSAQSFTTIRDLDTRPGIPNKYAIFLCTSPIGAVDLGVHVAEIFLKPVLELNPKVSRKGINRNNVKSLLWHCAPEACLFAMLTELITGRWYANPGCPPDFRRLFKDKCRPNRDFPSTAGQVERKLIDAEGNIFIAGKFNVLDIIFLAFGIPPRPNKATGGRKKKTGGP